MTNQVLMTKIGYDTLSEELRRLILVEREALKVSLAEARALGDLKENAEYHAAKEKQSHLEGKIQQIQSRLSQAKVIDPAQLKSETVVFGATVELIDSEAERNFTYQIVGHDESDAKNGKISYDSPLGRAMIGKRVGDTVTVKAPKGDLEYEITSISFGRP